MPCGPGLTPAGSARHSGRQTSRGRHGGLGARRRRRLASIPNGGAVPMIEVLTLTDGGQRAVEIAGRLAGFLGGARRSLDLALYDLKLSPEVAEPVVAAVHD